MWTKQANLFPYKCTFNQIYIRVNTCVNLNQLCVLIDGLQYKATYENVILVGSGTYGSVYYVRCDGDGDSDGDGDIVNKKVNFVGSGTLKVATM